MTVFDSIRTHQEANLRNVNISEKNLVNPPTLCDPRVLIRQETAEQAASSPVHYESVRTSFLRFGVFDFIILVYNIIL